MFVKIKADIRHWLRELDKKYFFVMLGFAVMVYFPLISLKLTNTVDGLWTTAEYMAGAWELSNGRWFWLVTSFLRFSLQLEPINAVVCLVLVSLGVTKLHMTFKTVHEGRTSCLDWLAGLCYLANTVIGCYLSFGRVWFGILFVGAGSGLCDQKPQHCGRHCAGSIFTCVESWTLSDRPCLLLHGAAGVVSGAVVPR